MKTNFVNSLHKLIGSYLACAFSLCKKLKDSYGLDETILRARRLNLIPKAGKIEDIIFTFHGIGCYFEFANGKHIDIDFGPDGSCKWFDTFRLLDYLSSMDKAEGSKYSDILTDIDVENQFHELLKIGLVRKADLDSSSNLFYLVPAKELTSSQNGAGEPSSQEK